MTWLGLGWLYCNMISCSLLGLGIPYWTFFGCLGPNVSFHVLETGPIFFALHMNIFKYFIYFSRQQNTILKSLIFAIFCLFLSETLYCTVYCIILLTRIIALYKNWCSKFSNICLFSCLSCPEESKHCIIWLLNSTTWHPYAYFQLPVTSDGSQETSNIAETDHTLYTHGWCVDGMG